MQYKTSDWRFGEHEGDSSLCKNLGLLSRLLGFVFREIFPFGLSLLAQLSARSKRSRLISVERVVLLVQRALVRQLAGRRDPGADELRSAGTHSVVCIRKDNLKAVGVRKIQLPRGVHDATPVPQVAQGSTLRHAVAVEACYCTAGARSAVST